MQPRLGDFAVISLPSDIWMIVDWTSREVVLARRRDDGKVVEVVCKRDRAFIIRMRPTKQ